MKKYLRMSSAAVVIGALRVKGQMQTCATLLSLLCCKIVQIIKAIIKLKCGNKNDQMLFFNKRAKKNSLFGHHIITSNAALITQDCNQTLQTICTTKN